MSELLPAGFTVGHWSDREAATGCTVVLPAAEGATASVDIRGGGTGTREIQLLDPLANPQRVHAVLLTGGSAFGLAAADGVVRWLERQGRGHPTPAGLVPLVPAAVLYDLASGDAAVRPGPDHGEQACDDASATPERGSVGAGTGAAVGKVLGREGATKGGVGIVSQPLPSGGQMAVLAVANAVGDVIAEDGAVLAGARRDGAFVRMTEVLRREPFELPKPPAAIEGNTTLVCVMTDARLDKTGCAIVSKMANAGMARAVDPVHSAIDGDVVFSLSIGTAAQVDPLVAGVIAAALTAEAIRDACRQAVGLAEIPALTEL